MGITDFFESLEQHYANQMPFVVYSRPINSIIKCWLQDNDQVFKTSTFNESGFVFAPFNLDEDPILFNEKHSKHYTLEVDNLPTETNEDSEISVIQANKDPHLKLVKHGIDTIGLGMFKKVVLSRTVQCDATKDHPIKIFKRLYRTYKNAMVYCWFHPKVGLWLGATPELLFKVEGLDITTISLAGTKPYRVSEDEISGCSNIWEKQNNINN